MITLEMPPEVAVTLEPVGAGPGDLFTLQLRVARRADELSRRRFAITREGDRRLWLRAELDVFEQAECAAS